MIPGRISGIVISVAGHDKGRLYAVLGTDGRCALLSDGKVRKTVNPKRKNLKHIKILSDYPISDDIETAGLRDSEIRKMLAAARKTEMTEEGVKLGKR